MGFNATEASDLPSPAIRQDMQLAFDVLPEVIFILDAESLQVVYANEAAATKLEENLPNFPFLKFKTDQTQNTSETLCQNDEANGPFLHVLKSGKPISVEEDLRDATGESTLYEISIIPLRNTDGHVDQLAQIYREIEDRTVADVIEEFRETPTKEYDTETSIFHRFFEHAASQLIIFDRDMTVIEANRSIRKSLHQKTETLIGRDFMELMVVESKNEFISRTKKLESQPINSFIVLTSIFKRTDGTVFPAEITIQKLTEDAPFLFMAMVLDITLRVRAEKLQMRYNDQLEAKSHELEQIVYVTSHDLRSPLVNIDGYSKELDRGIAEIRKSFEIQPELKASLELTEVLDEDLPDAMQFIHSSVRKMDILLSGLLRLSRSGRTEPHIELVDMNALMKDVCSTLQFRITSLDIHMEINALPPCMGDRDHLNQIFSNLLDNAIKYRHPERPARIQVSGGIEDDQVVYRVEDNGVGIEPLHQQKIFEVFHQLEPENSSGEGLGLTIVRNMLWQQSGEIRVEADPERGSCFIVELPMQTLWEQNENSE